MINPRLSVVLAALESPALLDTWWPAPLDGLLAAARGSAATGRPGPPGSLAKAPLPLVRWQRGLNKQWVWVASCVEVELLPVLTSSSRFLHDGPLIWRAAGDPDRIAALLQHIEQIGVDREAGRGRVGTWSVLDTGPYAPTDLPTVLWRGDGLIGRPVPVRGAAILGLDPAAVESVPGALRPPYSVAPRTPGGERRWRPVLAPWTRRPPDR